MESTARKEGCLTTQNPKIDDDIEVEINRHKETTGMKEPIHKGKRELKVNPEVMDHNDPWILAGRKPQRIDKRRNGKETKNMGNEKRMLHQLRRKSKVDPLLYWKI